MVMNSGNTNSLFFELTDDRIELVFQKHEIAIDHRGFPRLFEGGPTRQCKFRLNNHLARLDLQIGPGKGNLVYISRCDPCPSRGAGNTIPIKICQPCMNEWRNANEKAANQSIIHSPECQLS